MFLKETPDPMAAYVVEQHELIINKNYGKALSTNRSKEPKITGTTAWVEDSPKLQDFHRPFPNCFPLEADNTTFCVTCTLSMLNYVSAR